MAETAILPPRLPEPAKLLDRYVKELERYALRARDGYLTTSDYERILQLADAVRTEVVDLTSVKLRVLRVKKTGELLYDPAGIVKVVVDVIQMITQLKTACVTRDRSKVLELVPKISSEVYKLITLVNVFSVIVPPREERRVEVQVPPVSPIAQQVYAYIVQKGGRCKLSELYARFTREQVEQAIEELERYGYASRRSVDPATLDIIVSVY